jgi:hypothetical protein
VQQRWSENAKHEGHLAAARQLLSALGEFVRDSTPERRRLRYGDAEYDWEQRVDTTSGAVGWRDRLLGIFHSLYQPTDPALFRWMMHTLQQLGQVNFPAFTFIDLGSGKGRVLLMASDYPFRRIMGVELLPALHQIAQENLVKYHSETQRCFALEAIWGDAVEFTFPSDPLVLYLFNPLPEAVLRRVFSRLEQSLRELPRPLYVLYHNPLLEHVLAEWASVRKIGGTNQYALYAAE